MITPAIILNIKDLVDLLIASASEETTALK